MFNIVKKDNGICTIYKSGYIDAARCILKGNDHDITVVAEAEIKAMFSDMIVLIGTYGCFLTATTTKRPLVV